MPATRTIPFLDLSAQHAALREEISAALLKVLDETNFALGPAVESFEQRFAEWVGVRHAIGTNSGTSALHLALRALDIKPGDEVIVPAFTFVSPVSTVVYCGAKPVFADIDPQTFTLDPAAVEAAITPRTKAIIPVHLYGQPAEMTPLLALAEKHGLRLIEDAAQAHGARYHSEPAGTLGSLGCFSFYPTKNLGSAGEAGMVVTNDDQLAHDVRILRNWGSERRYEHTHLGYNYRMEGFQGAVLGVKLPHLSAWNAARRRISERYTERLQGLPGIVLPREAEGRRHVWHVYSVLLDERDRVRAELAECGVQTAIYYPIPLHLQPCFSNLGHQPGEFPAAESAARRQLALPIYPEMPDEDVEAVCEALKAVF